MDRNEIIGRLKSAERGLRSEGVRALFLFGSYARDEGNEDSDIDLFVDPADEETFGFDAFMNSYDALQRVLPEYEIGYSTRNGIARHFRPEIEREAVRIF